MNTQGLEFKGNIAQCIPPIAMVAFGTPLKLEQTLVHIVTRPARYLDILVGTFLRCDASHLGNLVHKNVRMFHWIDPAKQTGRFQ